MLDLVPELLEKRIENGRIEEEPLPRVFLDFAPRPLDEQVAGSAGEVLEQLVIVLPGLEDAAGEGVGRQGIGRGRHSPKMACAKR
ncbi:MAG: hypothetical protein P8049_08405 [Gemmatimonadota bacterium]